MTLDDLPKMLNEYVGDIQEQITESADRIAKEGQSKLRSASVYKKRTGKYNRGWRVKKSRGDRFVENTIYNATNYQLTHLLENGHANKDGSRTRAFTHIAPVEEYCVEKFKQEVEEIIKKG